MRRHDFIIGTIGAIVIPATASVAQKSRLPLVGYLSSASPATYPPGYLAAFRRGLGQAGYVEGKNVAIEFRWAQDRYDRLSALAAELVSHNVDVIAATGGLVSALAAKAATSTVPIVFAMGDDPVSAGVVASFARPGGNMTGVSFYVVELGAKLFGVATELVSNGTPVGVLVNSKRPSYPAVMQVVAEAAQAKGRKLIVLDASSEKDFEGAFAQLAQSHAGVLVVTSDPLFLDRREPLVALAARHAIPTVYAWREYADVGGLMSYGISLAGVYRTVGLYVGNVLAGHKTADLPIIRPTKFELVVNLKTAKSLGLTVPAVFLADEVIE